MAEQRFALSASDVPRVKRLLDAFEAGELNTPDPTGRRPFQSPVPFEFGVTNEATTAATTSATEISLHSSTGDTDKDEDAFPLFLGAAAEDTRVKIWRHQRSGRLYFDVVQPAAILFANVNESTGVAATDATFNVDNVVALSPIGSESTSSEITGVLNILGFPSTNTSEVLLFRKQATTTYYAIPHPERTTCT